MDIVLPAEIRAARRSDWKAVAAITAEAFADDPVMSWVFRSPRAILSMLRVLARDVYVAWGVCHLHSGGGATMWMPSASAGKPSSLTMAAFALGQLRLGNSGALARGEALQRLMQEHHPTAPHLYLFTIGARPEAQGQGIGKALLAPVLAACDRQGMPIYLENSNPVNHGFYVAHGFEQMGKFSAGDDAPPMAPMWRAPRESANEPHD